ncbi:hypothetical protein H6M51_11125 [Rhizobium sp. AQ_MP]|nr:hypothetical protein [Rhizobium sp. AQ_MP]
MPDPNAPGGVGLKDVGGIDVDPFIGALAYSEITYPGVLTSWPVTFAAADEITFDATLNSSVYGPGQSAQVTINQSVVNAALGRVDGAIPNQSALKTVIDYAFNLSSLSVLSNAAYSFGAVQVSIIPNQGSEIGHSIQISNVMSNLAGGYAFGIDRPPIKLVNNPYPKASFNFTSPFSVLDDAYFSFTLAMSVPGGGPMSVTTHTVNKAAVDAALGTADGRIGSAADYATVLAYVTSGSDVLFSATGGRVDADINTAVRPYQGLNSTFFIDNVAKHERTTGGSPSDPDDLTTFDFLGIDITTGNVALSSYISAVDNMLQKTVSGAAALGAVQSRIDMQSEFASKLYDSIASGIGRLVDADMNEASTRLKAQQTQEQLAIQSLSIANTSADMVLSLFRQ